jgi:hypothetical protein
VLSIIGPAPYDSAKKMESTSKEADFGREENKDVSTVASRTNEAMESGNTGHARTNAPFILNNIQKSKDVQPANVTAHGTANSGTVNDTEPSGKVSIVGMHL